MDSKELLMQLAEDIRVYMAKYRVSFCSMGQKTGLSRNELSMLAHGKVPSPTLNTITTVLDVIGKRIEFVEEKTVKEEANG